MSLLEWTLRDGIALGKQAEITEQIAKLEAKSSDDARLARLVFGLARDEPVDLSLLTKKSKDGTLALRPVMGDHSRVTPLDIDVVEQALALDEHRAAAVKLLDELLNIATLRHQDLFVTQLRHLKYRLRETEPAATHRDLAHWVISDEVTQSDVAAGQVPESLWIRRDDANTWGHQYGTAFSMLLLRYPLAGNFTVSFRTRDGTYAEGAATLAGRVLEFLEYRSTILVSGVGLRNASSLPCEDLAGNAFNTIRLDRGADSLTIHVGDDFEKQLGAPAGDFPFFGMGAHHYRETSFDSLQITPDATIPRSVDMLSPTLVGWSARFKAQRLPALTVLDEGPRNDDAKTDWRFAEGVLESSAARASDEKGAGKAAQRDAIARPRHEGLIRYLRPLCDGEQISLEFYHEPGKFSLAPALGRIALLLSDAQVALHWITSDSSGISTGVDDTNRVVDSQADQLRPVP